MSPVNLLLLSVGVPCPHPRLHTCVCRTVIDTCVIPVYREMTSLLSSPFQSMLPEVPGRVSCLGAGIWIPRHCPLSTKGNTLNTVGFNNVYCNIGANRRTKLTGTERREIHATVERVYWEFHEVLYMRSSLLYCTPLKTGFTKTK